LVGVFDANDELTRRFLGKGIVDEGLEDGADVGHAGGGGGDAGADWGHNISVEFFS
jgi:hypothetical protein